MVDETTPPKKPRKTKLSVVQNENSAPMPDPSNSGATAPSEGSGVAASPPSSKDKKKEKKIDWGKFNLCLERYALVYGTDTVWDGTKRMIMKIGNMAHLHGSGIVRMWKEHPDRRTVMIEQVVFDPSNQCDDDCVNLFDGIKLEPVEGDVEPIRDLLKYLVSRVSEDEVERDDIMHWLTCWMAYPLQHLGTKLRSAVIMHGDEGAGKNFLFDLLVDIYGSYGALVGQDELEDKFNDWRSGKMMVIGDEVSSRAELVHNKNRLKSLITSPTVQINPKGLPRRAEANFINIVFLSNELQPLALDNSDRRYCVIYTPPRKEQSYYAKLRDWRADNGAAKLYHWLLNYDCAGFDPDSPAPDTVHKQDLIDINRKSPERFWLEWSEGILDLPYQSCSMEQIYQGYTKYAQRIGDRFPLQANVFSRMVMRFSENKGKTIRVKTMQIANPTGGRKAHRMLLVTEPVIDEGQTEGGWATATVEAFASALRKYIGGGWGGGPRSPTEQEINDQGQP